MEPVGIDAERALDADQGRKQDPGKTWRAQQESS